MSDPPETKLAAVPPLKHPQRDRCTHIFEIFSLCPLSRALFLFFSSHTSCYRRVAWHWNHPPSLPGFVPLLVDSLKLLLFFFSIINSAIHGEESTQIKGYRLSSSILHLLQRHNFLLFLFFVVSFHALRHRKIATAPRHTP